MPMAAVLYPGKLLYALLPYSWAARLYVIAHTALALLGTFNLGRKLGLSHTGAFLGAVSYAFGSPVLSLHSNVIFLVGAAWVPWGFGAIHDLLASGKQRGMLELAVVLALQALGGDPEAAYLTVVAGAIYACVLSDSRNASSSGRRSARRVIPRLVLLATLIWISLVCGIAFGQVKGWVPKSGAGRMVAPLLGLGIAVLLLTRWRRAIAWSRFRARLLGLAGAGTLALLLGAAQLAPGWEFASQTSRLTGPSIASVYDFSIEPYRLAETAWPHVFGLEVAESRSWLQAFPPRGQRMLWTPSLYVGAFVLVLAITGAGLRGGPSWRPWLLIVTVLSLLAGMGKFAGPLWWARSLPGVEAVLGAHDPPGSLARGDALLADGAGSVYWVMATLLPGFGWFRYPGKLIVFTCLAVSSLAGLGWDRVASGGCRSVWRWCSGGLAASLVLALALLAARNSLESWLKREVPASFQFGPVDAGGALAEILWSVGQGGAVYAVGAVLAWVVQARPRLASAGVLVIVSADLALAGSRIVWTVPEADLSATPRVARLIEQAEREAPSPGPFRIHRVEQWHPLQFLNRRSQSRLRELVAWEHDTLDRLHAEPYSISYTLIRGLIDLDDYLDFFEAQAAWNRDDHGVSRPIYTFSRGGFDLWSARYFLMPVGLNGWLGEENGFTRIEPPTAIVADPDRAREWIEREGWQLLRNQMALPRAWVVHAAVVIPPTAPGSPERAELVGTLVRSATGAGAERGGRSIDLRRTSFVETEDPARLTGLRADSVAGPSGTVVFRDEDPQRIELSATLPRAGLVVLADLYYPGWELTVDGSHAPILRVNRMMRGALVQEGTHTLVYSYHPASFRFGLALSSLGVCLLAGLFFWAWQGSKKPEEPVSKAREPR
jgi:hypothetical protein